MRPTGRPRGDSALPCVAVFAIAIVACGSTPPPKEGSPSAPTFVTIHRRAWKVGDKRRVEITRTIGDVEDFHWTLHERIVRIDAVGVDTSGRGIHRIGLRVVLEGCGANASIDCSNLPTELTIERGDTNIGDDSHRFPDLGQFRELDVDANDLPDGPVRVGSSGGALFWFNQGALFDAGDPTLENDTDRLSAFERCSGNWCAVFDLAAMRESKRIEPKARVVTTLHTRLVVDVDSGRYVEAVTEGKREWIPTTVTSTPRHDERWRTRIVWSNES
jgi:hypothetical protein